MLCCVVLCCVVLCVSGSTNFNSYITASWFSTTPSSFVRSDVDTTVSLSTAFDTIAEKQMLGMYAYTCATLTDSIYNLYRCT